MFDEGGRGILFPLTDGPARLHPLGLLFLSANQAAAAPENPAYTDTRTTDTCSALFPRFRHSPVQAES